MKSTLALIKREYLEHRGAFLYAPAVILGLLVIAMALAFVSGRSRIGMASSLPSLQKFFEAAYGAFAGLWWFYLLIALFFYFADAFNADRRNNSMLFWKSMPQSDFKILGSKMAAGMTLFPALILVAAMITGVLAYAATVLAGTILPNVVVPDVFVAVGAFTQVTLAALASFVLGLLWYAPYFAWVGGLSTLVGRWSIPLAFLIPGFVVLLENLLLREGGPQAGYVWAFLSMRSDFGLEWPTFAALTVSNNAFSAMAYLSTLLTSIDWVSMAGGWVFAVALIYLASEYRRRIIAA